MSSESVHFKQIIMVDGAERALRQAVASTPHKYDEHRKTGFVISKVKSLNGMSTRLVFPKTVKAKAVNPEDLTSSDWLTKEWKTHFATDLEFDFKRCLAMVYGSRGGFKLVAESLGQMETVKLHFADLDVDILGVLGELRKQYQNLLVKVIGVKDYVDQSAYTANANFAADERAAQTDEFIARHKDRIHTIKVGIKKDDDDYTVQFNKKGSISFSAKGKEGKWPTYMYGYLGELFVHFNAVQPISDNGAPESLKIEGEQPKKVKLTAVA